jgi:hypothetical protein
MTPTNTHASSSSSSRERMVAKPGPDPTLISRRQEKD